MRPRLGAYVLTTLLVGPTVAHAVPTAIPSLNNPQENYYDVPSHQGGGYGVNIAGGLIHPSATPGHWEVDHGQSGTPSAWGHLLGEQLAMQADFLQRGFALQRLRNMTPPTLDQIVRHRDVVEFDLTGHDIKTFGKGMSQPGISTRAYRPGMPERVVDGERQASFDGGKTWGTLVVPKRAKPGVRQGEPYILYRTEPVPIVTTVPVDKLRAEFRKSRGTMQVRFADLDASWHALPKPIETMSSSGKMHQYSFDLKDAHGPHTFVLQTMSGDPSSLRLFAHRGGGDQKLAAGVRVERPRPFKLGNHGNVGRSSGRSR
jgi:hypothetical protein